MQGLVFVHVCVVWKGMERLRERGREGGREGGRDGRREGEMERVREGERERARVSPLTEVCSSQYCVREKKMERTKVAR